MSFSSDAWARNAALYEKTRDMPFNRELASGQLAEDAFKHYMIQDAHYLVAFGRALAIAAARPTTQTASCSLPKPPRAPSWPNAACMPGSCSSSASTRPRSRPRR